MTCCVTGNRPKGFPFQRNDSEALYVDYRIKLCAEIKKLILCGFDKFITGMADGSDIDFAEEVLRLQKTYSNISLEAVLPCPLYESKNPTENHKKREKILNLSSKVTLLSSHYYTGCMEKRNKFMVDNSDLVFAIWNGKKTGGTWNTIRYSQKKNKDIQYIFLCKLNDV